MHREVSIDWRRPGFLYCSRDPALVASCGGGPRGIKLCL